LEPPQGHIAASRRTNWFVAFLLADVITGLLIVKVAACKAMAVADVAKLIGPAAIFGISLFGRFVKYALFLLSAGILLIVYLALRSSMERKDGLRYYERHILAMLSRLKSGPGAHGEKGGAQNAVEQAGGGGSSASTAPEQSSNTEASARQAAINAELAEQNRLKAIAATNVAAAEQLADRLELTIDALPPCRTNDLAVGRMAMLLADIRSKTYVNGEIAATDEVGELTNAVGAWVDDKDDEGKWVNVSDALRKFKSKQNEINRGFQWKHCRNEDVDINRRAAVALNVHNVEVAKKAVSGRIATMRTWLIDNIGGDEVEVRRKYACYLMLSTVNIKLSGNLAGSVNYDWCNKIETDIINGILDKVESLLACAGDDAQFKSELASLSNAFALVGLCGSPEELPDSHLEQLSKKSIKIYSRIVSLIVSRISGKFLHESGNVLCADGGMPNLDANLLAHLRQPTLERVLAENMVNHEIAEIDNESDKKLAKCALYVKIATLQREKFIEYIRCDFSDNQKELEEGCKQLQNADGVCAAIKAIIIGNKELLSAAFEALSNADINGADPDDIGKSVNEIASVYKKFYDAFSSSGCEIPNEIYYATVQQLLK
jgi:hypothetical protein